tara:strand:+ start:399 stop:1196 length:798 start_codon:yes stop_codon:yes gene_type:complete
MLIAGSLLPFLVKAGSAAKLPLLLRTAGVLGGAAPGLMRGDLGSAVTGGALGGLTTLGLGGAVGGLGTKAAGAAASQIGKTGIGAVKGMGLAGNLKAQELAAAAVKAGVPVAAGLGIGRLAGGGLGGGSNVARGGAGLLGYGSVRGEGMGGAAVPPGMGQFGGVSPTGDPLNVLSPLGLDAGRRLRTIKDAEALRDAQNIVLPTVRKFAEQAKRDEFARSMAGAGIRQNIATQAALTENMQRAGLNLGMTAAQQAGDALTQRYNY